MKVRKKRKLWGFFDSDKVTAKQARMLERAKQASMGGAKQARMGGAKQARMLGGGKQARMFGGAKTQRSS